MLTTRFMYIILFLINVVINGLALLHLAEVYASVDQIVPAALLFNLLFWPVAMFAAYRMGGMTEEIYRRKELAALEAAARQNAGSLDTARQPPKSQKPIAADATKPDKPSRTAVKPPASKTADMSRGEIKTS